ncbi:RASEF protein, partial [Eubucco bourcierii]|nr:RASEF protein [Eubucco bourcierii]
SWPRYRSIAQSYFRKAHGVLLLYDISSPSSFLSVCHWIEDIKVGKGLTGIQASWSMAGALG